jgi:trehalose 6-phosphate synthase/phosphatase
MFEKAAPLDLSRLLTQFRQRSQSRRRLVLLDYDGTLVPITGVPANARPTQELLDVLGDLCGLAEVYVVTGRDRRTMEEWLHKVPSIGIAAEHGQFLRPYCKTPPLMASTWEDLRPLAARDAAWKPLVHRMMDKAVQSVPGSHLECKETNLTWHYRLAADAALAERVRAQLLHDFQEASRGDCEGLHVLEAKAAIEVRPSGLHKGSVAARLLEHSGLAAAEVSRSSARSDSAPDFVLCVGDDRTDEDMFAAVNGSGGGAHYFTVRVAEDGHNAQLPFSSAAKYFVHSPEEVVGVLRAMVDAGSS